MNVFKRKFLAGFLVALLGFASASFAGDWRAQLAGEKSAIACAAPTVPQCVLDPSIPPNPMLPGANTHCSCVCPGDLVRGPDTLDGYPTCVPPPPPAPVPMPKPLYVPHQVCELLVTFDATMPFRPTLVARTANSQCDDQALALALSSALAKLLGSPLQ